MNSNQGSDIHEISLYAVNAKSISEINDPKLVSSPFNIIKANIMHSS